MKAKMTVKAMEMDECDFILRYISGLSLSLRLVDQLFRVICRNIYSLGLYAIFLGLLLSYIVLSFVLAQLGGNCADKG